MSWSVVCRPPYADARVVSTRAGYEAALDASAAHVAYCDQDGADHDLIRHPQGQKPLLPMHSNDLRGTA